MDDDDASWMRPGAAAATVEGARRVILRVISAMLQRSNETVESNRSRGRVDTGRSMLFFACCSSSRSVGTQQRRRRRSLLLLFCVFGDPRSCWCVWCVVCVRFEKRVPYDGSPGCQTSVQDGANPVHRRANHLPRGFWSQLIEKISHIANCKTKKHHDKIARTSAAIGTCLCRL